MAGRYPKPDAERRNRAKPTFEWTPLPPQGRQGDPPALPEWRLWHPETLKWWAKMWAKPQAVAWDQTGSSMWPLLMLYDDLISSRVDAAKVSAEMRQHEDRHGLNPKALLQLRWRITDAAVSEEPKLASVSKMPVAVPKKTG